MKASRDITRVIHFILDELCPPILRDRWAPMSLIYRVALGKEPTRLLYDFKEKAQHMTDAEYARCYAITAQVVERPTDLDRAGLEFILDKTQSGGGGGGVLDAGCGRGFLAKKLSEAGNLVTGLDIERPRNYSPDDGYSFIAGSLEHMPFSDGEFDIVVCAHVLEHIMNLDCAISEILRVAKQRVILVLPRQREYRYTPDLHLHFFPYLYNVQRILPVTPTWIGRVGHDWGVLIDKKDGQAFEAP